MTSDFTEIHDFEVELTPQPLSQRKANRELWGRGGSEGAPGNVCVGKPQTWRRYRTQSVLRMRRAPGTVSPTHDPNVRVETVVVVVVVTLKDLPDLHSPVEGHLMRMSSVVTG